MLGAGQGTSLETHWLELHASRAGALTPSPIRKQGTHVPLGAVKTGQCPQEALGL